MIWNQEAQTYQMRRDYNILLAQLEPLFENESMCMYGSNSKANLNA